MRKGSDSEYVTKLLYLRHNGYKLCKLNNDKIIIKLQNDKIID